MNEISQALCYYTVSHTHTQTHSPQFSSLVLHTPSSPVSLHTHWHGLILFFESGAFILEDVFWWARLVHLWTCKTGCNYKTKDTDNIKGPRTKREQPLCQIKLLTFCFMHSPTLLNNFFSFEQTHFFLHRDTYTASHKMQNNSAEIKFM